MLAKSTGYSDGGCAAGDGDEVVAAGMPDPSESVVFGIEADDGTGVSVGRLPGGRKVESVLGDGEAGLLSHVGGQDVVRVVLLPS